MGQAVWVRNVKVGPKWVAGEVCAKTGPVSYEVNVDGQVWKCHADQLLSQFGSNYQPPDAHVSTEIDGGLPLLVDFSWVDPVCG